MAIDKDLLKKIIEGALLAAGQPLSRNKLHSLLIDPENENAPVPDKDEVLAALQDIQADTRGRGFELKEVSSGWRFQIVEETANWVNRLWDEKPQKYSRAMLETLSLIAYRQPITRGDIEEIRGVAVSSYIIKTLVERDWIKVVGQRDVPGRPSLFATTRVFLDYFNLKSLDELPSLGEISDLTGLNAELDLEVEQALTGAVKDVEFTAGDHETGAETTDSAKSTFDQPNEADLFETSAADHDSDLTESQQSGQSNDRIEGDTGEAECIEPIDGKETKDTEEDAESQTTYKSDSSTSFSMFD